MHERARPDPTPHLVAVARAVTETDQPATALAALDKALDQAFGHKLFTVLVVNLEANENQRYYSSRPMEYPVGGAKTIVHEGIVARRVIQAGECHINRNFEDIKSRLLRSRADPVARLRELDQRAGALERADLRHAQPAAPRRVVHRSRHSGPDGVRGDRDADHAAHRAQSRRVAGAQS